MDFLKCCLRHREEVFASVVSPKSKQAALSWFHSIRLHVLWPLRAGEHLQPSAKLVQKLVWQGGALPRVPGFKSGIPSAINRTWDTLIIAESWFSELVQKWSGRTWQGTHFANQTIISAIILAHAERIMSVYTLSTASNSGLAQHHNKQMREWIRCQHWICLWHLNWDTDFTLNQKAYLKLQSERRNSGKKFKVNHSVCLGLNLTFLQIISVMIFQFLL